MSVRLEKKRSQWETWRLRNITFRNCPWVFPAITETHLLHIVPSLSLSLSLSTNVSVVDFKSLFDGTFSECYRFDASVNSARS